jgi:hypothetical protein
MQTVHTINIFLHVTLGITGLILGSLALIFRQPLGRHQKLGKYFLLALLGVVVTGFLGFLFFRSNPFLLMLTILSSYVGYSGYRTVQVRQGRASVPDILTAVAAIALGISYLVFLNQSGADWSPAVVYSTLSGLLIVSGYDLIKHFLLFNRLRNWWLYEHIYKMLSAYSAILSAFTGTVLPGFKPYSQIMPGIFTFALIVYFISNQIQKKNARKASETSRA